MNKTLTVDFGSDTNMAMIAVLVAAVGILALSLWSAQKRHPHFDLFDLLMEEGRVSNVKCVLMGAFAVTTWMMINLTLTGRMTEGYFSAYVAGWVAPIIIRMFSNKEPKVVEPQDKLPDSTKV